MKSIAGRLGYQTQLLITKDATRDAVKSAIEGTAKQLSAGDIFFVSYSGHGGQVPDLNDDEPDASDETWCLYDGQLIDDELFQLWKRIPRGVRVLVLSDSCHSGSVTRVGTGTAATDSIVAAGYLRAVGIEKPVYRFMPMDVALRTYRANKSFYDALGQNTKPESGELSATIRLISGCQDNQLSLDGAFNGLFTGTLLRVWKEGRFEGDYRRFHAEIINRMPSSQTPNHFVIGPSDATYERQKPFVI
jgi:hypothetical protein